MTVDLHHADALEFIVGHNPRDWGVLLIDPPYGIDASMRSGSQRSAAAAYPTRARNSDSG